MRAACPAFSLACTHFRSRPILIFQKSGHSFVLLFRPMVASKDSTKVLQISLLFLSLDSKDSRGASSESSLMIVK